MQQSAQTLFEFNLEVVQAELGVETLNGESIEQFSDQLPPNVALFVEQCLATCGLKGDVTPNQGDSSANGTAPPMDYPPPPAGHSAPTGPPS